MKIIATAIAAVLMAASGFAIGTGAAKAVFAQNDQVCEGLSSGKIDVGGDQKTITITAPDGFLISRYCVKAGSANQGDGPVYVDVNPPVRSITISHPSGKDISHYSYELIREGDTTTTETTTTQETTTTDTSTQTTPTTVTTATTPTQPGTTTQPPTTTTSSAGPVTAPPRQPRKPPKVQQPPKPPDVPRNAPRPCRPGQRETERCGVQGSG